MLRKKKIIIIIAIILAITFVVIMCHNISKKRNLDQIYGASFNAEYATYLELDPLTVFTSMIDDLGFRYLRISAQWEEIEKSPGIYDFSFLNKLMDEAAKKNVKITLVVGQKIPRWPECHAPKWTEGLSDLEYRAAIKRLIKTTVDQYKDHPALEIWQVENEPLLKFGECRFFGQDMLASEIGIVRQIDPKHKIMITDSGELSSWRNTAKTGDLFGTTLYRVVWNKRWGYFSYDWISPLFYRFKLWLTGQKNENAFISELQAEPWIPDHDLNVLSLDEQYKSMNLERFEKNVIYAQRIGFPRAYLWGTEWWYWMKESKGISDFLDYAKTLKKE